MVRALQSHAVLAAHTAYWAVHAVRWCCFVVLLVLAPAGCHDQVEGVTAAGACN